MATAPIFTFLLAFALSGEERAGALSLVGVGIGVVGVGLLLGVDAGGGTSALVGGLLVVLASFGYGLGAWFLKRRIRGVQPVGVVAATMAASALMVFPLALIDLPPHGPGLDTVGALAALGVLGTGVSFVLFYSLIGGVGPARASLVAYVAPGFSVDLRRDAAGRVLRRGHRGRARPDRRRLVAGGRGPAALAAAPGGHGQRECARRDLAQGSWARRAGGELAAGGVDVAAAGEPHGGAHAASSRVALKAAIAVRGRSPGSPTRSGCRGSGSP